MTIAVNRSVWTAFAVALTMWLTPAANAANLFRAERLIIQGRDVTAFRGLADLEVPSDDFSTDIELAFALAPGESVDITKMSLVCSGRGGLHGGLFGPQSFRWSPDCEYDAAARRGVFRVRRFPLLGHASYIFSVDISKISQSAPRSPVHEFYLTTYPSLPHTGMDSLPFYVIDEQPRDFFLLWPTAVYEAMNRQVPPSTSLFFTFSLPSGLWPESEPVAPHLKLILLKMKATNEGEAFRPLRVQADLPRGSETLVYDGAAGGAKGGFVTQIREVRTQGECRIWIRKPAAGRPAYENTEYLEPGGYYSLQFELTRPPFAGKRYEATRFQVRPAVRQQKCTVTADYLAPNFVDWRGDWYNGHAPPSFNLTSPIWGQDFALALQARRLYPDLWRTIALGGIHSDFSSMFKAFPNVFRDRSQRAVTKAERAASGELVVTLGHISGAQSFSDPDNPADTLRSHPVVGDDKEQIYHAGDRVFLQAASGPDSVPFFGPDRLLAATVKATRPEINQLVLETDGDLWPISPEASPVPFPAVLGPPGSRPTTIALPPSYTGTYLRLQNGRPYVNWAILDDTFDFLVDTLGLQVMIGHTYVQFVGDVVTGRPTKAGWQLLSDCEYYLMRHLLRRYQGGLDTFTHGFFGEGTGWNQGGEDFVSLYDYSADGIVRAYEDVLGVHGEDYQQIRIGLNGMMLSWGVEYIIRWELAHCLPAPLGKVFPESAPAQWPASESLPRTPAGSNPLYYFTAEDRERFRRHHWEFNPCFLDEAGRPIVGPQDWDRQGKLTPAALRRLQPGWRNSRWLLEHTRYGKGTPFRSLGLEAYGYTAEGLARTLLAEKELLAQLDQNLRKANDDPYVQTYLQGISSGTSTFALFDWVVKGDQPVGQPFRGTGYWPTYFADVMRRDIAEAATQPRGIYDVGTFMFDTFIGPDGNNSGTVSDTAVFPTDPKPKTARAVLSNGKQLEVETNTVTLEKDVRNFISFIGMMTHRLAALPEQTVAGHVVSGLVSKHWDHPPAGIESGNGPGDEHKCYILLYDHYPPDLESQDRAQIPVRLHVCHLPLNVKSARVTVHRLDKEHGSFYPITGQPGTPARSPIWSPDEVAALRKASQLARDESFARNGGRFAVSTGAIDLDLALAANRVLFVEVDWGSRH